MFLWQIFFFPTICWHSHNSHRVQQENCSQLSEQFVGNCDKVNSQLFPLWKICNGLNSSMANLRLFVHFIKFQILYLCYVPVNAKALVWSDRTVNWFSNRRHHVLRLMENWVNVNDTHGIHVSKNMSNRETIHGHGTRKISEEPDQLIFALPHKCTSVIRLFSTDVSIHLSLTDGWHSVLKKHARNDRIIFLNNWSIGIAMAIWLVSILGIELLVQL